MFLIINMHQWIIDLSRTHGIKSQNLFTERFVFIVHQGSSYLIRKNESLSVFWRGDCDYSALGVS